MIVYLDTSALVKLYVDEPGSDAVRQTLARAEMVATCTVAYAEARAALARRTREGVLATEEARKIQQALDGDWRSFVTVAVTDVMAQRAGDLAERYALRGFDAIHLAAAKAVGEMATTTPHFSCFDARLNEAAQAEGFILEP